MGWRKMDRSSRTPLGWRLATVEEAKANLETIKRDNLLKEWDRVRLLDGWMGGDGYGFNVEEGFRPCLGYMLLLESPTTHTSDADERRAVTYSEVLPKLSKEGRNATAILCCEDSNEKLLHCLLGVNTQGNERKEASEVVSAIAREWQDLFAKSRTIYSSDIFNTNVSTITEYLEDLVDNIEKFLTTLMTKIPDSLPRKLKDEIVIELKINNYLPENLRMYNEEQGREVAPETVYYFEVEKVAWRTFHTLCSKLFCKMKMHSDPSLTYLMSRAYALNLNKIVDEVSKGSDYSRYFSDLSLDQTVTCEDASDVLSSCLLREAKEAKEGHEANEGHINVVTRLLESGVQASPRNGQETKTDSRKGKIFDTAKWSPLHYAAWNGNCSMCTLLIQHKASVRSRDALGRTPLVYTLMFWDYEVVDVLISNEGEDEGGPCLVDIDDGDGFSVFHNSDRYGVPANMIVRLLSRSRRPKSHFGPNGLNKDNLSEYLRESSLMGYVDLVQTLLEVGADPFEGDGEGKTSLHYAAEGDDENLALQIIEELLAGKNEGSINWAKATVGDRYGRNVLHIAALLGRKTLCSSILTNQTDMIDSKDLDGQVAMHYAVAGPHDNPEVFSSLKSRGATKILVKDNNETTLLHVAARSGNLNMVKELISLIPDKNYVETADAQGQTALHKAASGGHPGIVETLLAQGAHPLKSRDSDGKTALDFAAQANPQNAVEVAKLLLKKCEPEEQKSFLLFTSAVGNGLSNSSLGNLEKFIQKEKGKIGDRKVIGDSLRVAAKWADVDLTIEIITKGADISIITDKVWIDSLPKEENKKVQDVLSKIRAFVDQRTDKPALEDNLGRSSFAIGLAALFLNPFVKSPVTVGISGEWGMGKSSVMLQTEINLLKAAAQLTFKSSFQKNNLLGGRGSKLSITGQAKRRKIANAIEKIDAESRHGLHIMDNIRMSIKHVKNFKTKVKEQATHKIDEEKKEQATQQIDEERKEQATQQAASHVTYGHNHSRLGKFWGALQILWKRSTPSPSLGKFNDFNSRLHQFLTALKALWEESASFDLDKFYDFLENKYQLKYHQIFKSLAVIDRHYMFEEDNDESGNQTSAKMSGEKYSLQETPPSILTVQYNAWHYRNETEAWAGLAVEITKELEATMTMAHKLRTSWLYNWKNRRNIICFEVILPYFIALMVAIWLSTIIWFVLDTKHKDLKKVKYGGLPISMIVAAWGLGKSVISFVKPISSQVLDYLCIPDHSKKLGYHQQVINDINFLKENLHYKRSFKWEVFAFFWCWITWSWDKNNIPGTNIRKIPPASGDNLRMIVFVDDLDRCEENVILKVLSAVNLVLATCHINVILGMENSMIKRAILRKYGNNNTKDDKSNEELAEKYLRKIVQLPLYLPDPSDSEFRDFLERQIGIWNSAEEEEDSMESSIEQAKTENETAQGQSKVNPKYQIATRTRGKYSRDTHTAEQVPGQIEKQETIEYSEISRVEEITTENYDAPAMEQPQERSGNQESKIEILETHGVQEPQIKNEKIDSWASQITRIFRCVFELPCNRSQKEIGDTTEGDEKGEQPEEGIKQPEKGSKSKGSLMYDISTIISAMLIPRYSELEKKTFSFLHDRCTCSRKLPREWKCFMAYHRLAWNIFYLTPQVKKGEGWKVQLIAWIFVCWEWRELITILITTWNKLEVLRNWISEEGPSLKDIVEHYIDERWKNSGTEMTVEAIDQEQGKPMAEENITLEEMKKALSDVLKEQKEMRDMLKMIIKNVCKEEDDREGESSVRQQGPAGKENQRRIIKKIFMEEEDNEGESSLQLYTMVEENRISKKARDEEEREEWIRLRSTLRVCNVSMDNIQAFQKFRFHCQAGHLPWPLPKQD